MKLGKSKTFFIKTILIFLFVCFVSITTISYLYNTSNISNEEYINLLLSDTYGDNFYIKLVEMINKNFNPLNVIELGEVESNNFSLGNAVYSSNPIVYIYNYDQDETYKEEYNIHPSIMLSSYFLSNKLNELGINTIFEECDIKSFSSNNNLSYDDAVKHFVNDKLNLYPSLEYIINIGITSNVSNITKVNGKRYANISLYANKNNIILLSKINNVLNKKYKGISKIYVDEDHNESINIDIGGTNNSMLEVINSIDAFAYAFKEVM